MVVLCLRFKLLARVLAKRATEVHLRRGQQCYTVAMYLYAYHHCIVLLGASAVLKIMMVVYCLQKAAAAED